MSVRITEHGVVVELKTYTSNSKTMMLNIVIDETVRLKTKRWKPKNRQALHVVIMNMMACVSKKQRLYYHRSREAIIAKRYNERQLSNVNIMNAIDELEADGYLFNYIAPRQYGAIEDKHSSYVVATDKFIDKFCTEDEIVSGAEFEHIQANVNIVMKDSKKKKIDYIVDATVAEAERVVAAVNSMNSQHVFIDFAGDYMVNMYCRIFNNDSFDFGGRWFRAAILAIKNKLTMDRLRTTIDDEQVVEVDLDCLHISMLCDILGVSKYNGIDIYYHVLEKQHYSTDNRRLVKLGINIMLNAKSVHKAKCAIDDIIKEGDKKYCYTTGKEVMDAIYKALPEFKDSFCNKKSTGLSLQNRDSWIAHYVLDEFVKIQQPILVVHDSFIVQRKNADSLIDAMSAAYKKVMQVDRVVGMKMNWLEDNVLQTVDCSK